MSVKRLGKGLEALIRSDEDKGENNSSLIKTKAESISKIKLNHIHPNPNQPRKLFDAVALDELAASISEKGLISPITVRKVKNGYELIAGERRWRALKHLKKRTVPAYVLDTKNNSDIMEMALVENIQREDLKVVEEAKGYQRLINKNNYTHESLANIVGKSRSHITNLLRILSLHEYFLDLLNKGKISIIEINSETDFVAKNQDFINFCKELSKLNFEVKGDLSKLNESKMNNGIKVKDNLVNLIAKIGEKITIRRANFFDNLN